MWWWPRSSGESFQRQHLKRKCEAERSETHGRLLGSCSHSFSSSMENIGLVPVYFLAINNISVLIPIEQILPVCMHPVLWHCVRHFSNAKRKVKRKYDLIFTPCKNIFLVKMLFLNPCIPCWCWNTYWKKFSSFTGPSFTFFSCSGRAFIGTVCSHPLTDISQWDPSCCTSCMELCCTSAICTSVVKQRIESWIAHNLMAARRWVLLRE